jgi:hypothetical protein
VRKAIDFLEPLIEAKALSVDKALFRRAMSHLLHNAIT